MLNKIRTWRSCPVRFVIDVFGVVPDPWQVEALTHLADCPKSYDDYKAIYSLCVSEYEKRLKKSKILEEVELFQKCLDFSEKWTDEYLTVRYEGIFGKVSVRSGHGVGKTTTMAWAGLWHQMCFFPTKCGTTAPTAHQLEDVLWAEIPSWYNKAPEALRSQFKITSLRMEMNGRESESFMVGRTARREQPEALQGLHQDNMMILVDEASGVDDIIFEVAEGTLTSKSSRIFLGGNPTRTQGYFFDSHSREGFAEIFHRMRVSCYDSPRVHQSYIDACEIRYGGKDTNRFRVRVLGDFPSGEDDTVIPLHLMEDSVGREVSTFDWPVVWGVDVARFGDDRSALAKRKGNELLEQPLWWANKDTMQLSGLVVQEYYDTEPKMRPAEIFVDVIGIGAGVVDSLRETGLPVIGVNVSESPAIKERYMRKRDELWFRTREWFEARNCKVPHGCDRLILELSQPRYKDLSSGKIQVESKNDVKKRSFDKRSPDLGDAFILTFNSTKRETRSHQRLKYPRYHYV